MRAAMTFGTTPVTMSTTMTSTLAIANGAWFAAGATSSDSAGRSSRM